VKAVRLVATFVFTVALGGAALGGTLALLAPAGSELREAAAIGPLDIEGIAPAERSYMYDRYGNLMTTLFAEEDRSPIALEAVPAHLIDAVLAIEDRNFYEHAGVDPAGIARALRENVEAGEVAQGGSTITQQLVKNLFTDPTEERDFLAKAKEAVLAVRLEDVLDKDEILERYLNVVYFGNGAYGVQAAAERYFAKQPADLSLGEAALLAGLIQAPEALNPVTHPDRAARRRQTVLRAMVETGTITEGEADAANAEPLPTSARSPLRSRDFFTTEVIEHLLNDDPAVEGDVAERLGPTQPIRYNQVFRGGLRIHTTYDPVMQYVAGVSVAEILPDTPVVASVVIVDNADMSVRAMFPGFDFSQLQYNPITTRGRQTGSAFKAITLATALERGYSPDDLVSGSSLFLERPGEDYSLSCGSGTMTLEDAIARSNNCAFVRTLVSMGPGNFGNDGAAPVIEMAGRLGIDTSKLDQVPTLTLGVSDTNMLDMAEAFAVFANEGVHRPPMFVTRVEDADGDVIYEADPNADAEQVLSVEVARTETELLRGVIDHGTATRADIGRPAAGKTGTTTDNTDAWFVGYTPQLTAAVWMGFPDRPVSMSDFGLGSVQGGTYPATIWAAIMEPLHEQLEVRDFAPPDEDLWPRGRRISEDGRDTRDYVPPPETTTVPPPETTTVPPQTTTTRPKPSTTTVPGTTPTSGA
jgi:penicillin-binding protein 1A